MSFVSMADRVLVLIAILVVSAAFYLAVDRAWETLRRRIIKHATRAAQARSHTVLP